MKRAVLMIVDGLRADMVTPQYTPNLAKIAQESCVFSQHRSVFPSATRINSASIATGCYPGNHGLAGNAIALDEGDGLKPVSVGPAEFRERWRRATGRTLHRPTLAERLHKYGGAVIYSNSSAGAAHMQDPDSYGWLYHRSGSFAPGMQPMTGSDHLDVSYDAAGDAITTQRCCDALLKGPQHALTVLWICEPDHSQHALELGSPQHREVLQAADACAGELAKAVKQLVKKDDDIIFILASDHGHETVSEIVPVNQLLVEAGFKEHEHSSEVVLASSGMSALIYLAEPDQKLCAEIANWLRAQPWSDQVYVGTELESIGHRSDTHLAIAFAMAKQDLPNRFGIRGLGAVAADVFMPDDALGLGQHGGLGRYETNPMLMIQGGGFAAGAADQTSSAVDIAPTVLSHLEVSYEGMDGSPLKPNILLE